jgi:iturin family lipopeptide synthetase A
LSGYIAEAGIERIDLLKINVEKSELDVLQGIDFDDWRKIRQLVIEVDLSQNLEPITSLLEQQGFDVLVEQDPLLRSTDLCYVYAIRPSAADGSQLIREQAPDAHLRSVPPVAEQILTPTTLRKYLLARLPHFMVPAAFVLMEELPLTANGKIDREALPLVTSEQARPGAGAATAPRTATEQTLAAMWTELLKVEQVGIEDDFFELGGHSLLAIQLVSRIRDTFGVDLPLRNLFEHPTVAKLAETIDALAWVSRPSSADAPDPGAAGDREEITV